MASAADATGIVRRLREAGFEALWVGGCVRDGLLGREPTDYDIATSARPEEVERLFPRTVPVGRQFGVMLVMIGPAEYQVATFRTDSLYSDGRRPDSVQFAGAVEDARRRDFTINGLFLDPLSGTVFDWVGGQEDLRARRVRTIGDADERFAEDRLRLLRAVRFAAQLGFGIEEQTLDALRRRADTLRTVSAERIRDELMKLFRPPHAGRGLRLLRETGLLEHAIPELAETVGCEQSPDYHPEGTVFEHLARMLELLPEGCEETLPWAVLMHDIAKPRTASRDPETGNIHFYTHEKVGAEMAEEILRRLRFSRKQIDEVTAAVRHHMQFKDVAAMRRSTRRRMILRPTFRLEMELHRLDCLGSHGRLDNFRLLQNECEEMQRQPELAPPLLTGSDLIALGMEPGPKMGALLHEMREKQLQEELHTPDEAREWARKQIERVGGAPDEVP